MNSFLHFNSFSADSFKNDLTDPSNQMENFISTEERIYHERKKVYDLNWAFLSDRFSVWNIFRYFSWKMA
jgi:hypothetical protein